MNKKTLIVIFIAGILALLGALAIYKVTQKHEIIEPVKVKETIIPIPEPEPVKAEEIKPEEKPIVANQVKKVSYKKPAPKPTVKEAPVIKPIVVKEAEPEGMQNEGVIQEENSKDVVITQEYKIQSPAKYTFK